MAGEAGIGRVESGAGVAVPAIEVSLEDQAACVEREIGMREKLYPRWVRETKLTQVLAELELVRMRAVLRSIQALQLVNGMAAMLSPEAVKIAERERVLAIVGRHMHSSPFLRVAAKVRE